MQFAGIPRWAKITSGAILAAALCTASATTFAQGALKATAAQLGLYVPGTKPPTPPGGIKARVINVAKECGAWGNPNTTGSVANHLLATNNSFRMCLPVGNHWVMDFNGSNALGISGSLAVYTCNRSDTACLDGQNDHPLTGWKVYNPPTPGEVAFQESVSSDTVLVVVNGVPMEVNLNTGQYSSGS